MWGVDPARHFDTVPVAWGRVADVSIFEHRLIGCSFAGGSVGVYVVDLKRVAPFSGGGGGSGAAVAAMGGLAGAGAAARAQEGKAPGVGGAAVADGRLVRQQQEQRQPPPQQHWDQQQQREQQQREQETQQQRRAQAEVAQVPPAQEQGQGPARVSRGGGSAGALPHTVSDRQREPPKEQPAARLLRQQRSVTDKGSAGGGPATGMGPDADRPGPLGMGRQRTPPGELRSRGGSASSSGSSLAAAGEAALAAGGGRPKSSSVGTGVGDSLARGHLQQQQQLAGGGGPLRALMDDDRHQRDAATSMGGAAPPEGQDGRPHTSSGGGGGGTGASRRASGNAFPEVEIRVPSHPPPAAAPPAGASAPPAGDARPQRDDGVSATGASRSAAGRPPLGPQAAVGPAPFAAAPAGAGSSRYGGSSAGGGAAAQAAPPAAAHPPPPPQQQQPLTSLHDPLLAAAAYRPSLRSDLSRALSTLQIARGFVSRGNVEGAYRAAAQSGDAAAAAMLLEALQGRKDAFDVSSTEALARALEACLSGGPEHEHAAAVALGALSLALRGPGQVIRETLGASAIGVDLNFEARRDKCVVAKLALQGLGMKLGVLARGAGPLAARAQQVAAELQSLDAV